jgi:DNA-binding PucR family transcriptional regulator
MRQDEVKATSHDASLRKIVARIEGTFDDSVARAAAAIRDQVAAYRELDHDGLDADLVANVRAVFRVLLTSLVEDRAVSPEEVSATRVHAARRVRQGVPLAAYLQAFRVGQLTLWEDVLAASRDNPETRETALSIVERIMHLIETCSTQAAEAYLEAERHQFAEADRLRRDLLEDLLARADVSAAPKLAMLQRAGLESGRALAVVLARPVAPTSDGRSLADAVATLGRGDAAAPGLTVARQNEVVGVVPVPAGGFKLVVSGLERATAELAQRGIEMAVGVSMTHERLTEVPEAYAEAWAARDGLGSRHGVFALPMLSTFDYLMLRADDTARRLIRPRYRRFIEEDTAKGGALITTLLRYVACDLNATAAARHLHMHVNTVYYRLERVSERSGCDLRRFTELQELILAIHLLRAAASS